MIMPSVFTGRTSAVEGSLPQLSQGPLTAMAELLPWRIKRDVPRHVSEGRALGKSSQITAWTGGNAMQPKHASVCRLIMENFPGQGHNLRFGWAPVIDRTQTPLNTHHTIRTDL
jgi:hypothetical protein